VEKKSHKKITKSHTNVRKCDTDGVRRTPPDHVGECKVLNQLIAELLSGFMTNRLFMQTIAESYAGSTKVKQLSHVQRVREPLSVSDFVSADYGWLRSPDKSKEARVLFKAGKNREGYFQNEDILNQTTTAMDILTEFYPKEEHILVYDNATTLTKRSDTALSARHMPKGTKRVGEFWGATIPVLDRDRQQVYQRDKDGKLTRKPEKIKVHMDDAQFVDGSPQKLYFPENHPTSSGCFKGMAVLLQERGLIRESKLRTECAGFKCVAGATSCCCRRMLYSQPDFVAVESLLEGLCCARGFQVLLLPKFHCELNFIEQCWGYAKQKYREFPPSSKEADLEKNLLCSLEMVSLESMRR
jgi:hypothetical protein